MVGIHEEKGAIRMSSTAALVLWLFVIFLGIAFGAGVYEHQIVVPRWITASA
jgi:hypothetical protein